MSPPSQDGSSLLTALVKSLAAIGALSVGATARRAASTAGGYAIVALLFAVSLCYLFLALVAALVLQVRRR
jgi:hypothetical protein